MIKLATLGNEVRSQLVSRSDEGGLFGSVLSILTAVVLVGLGLALYKNFDGDIMAILDWAWNGVTWLINTIADFISSNSFFQQAVR